MPTLDLINPGEWMAENYRHQIRQTIGAYSIPYLVAGEALQNAIDAVSSPQAKRAGEIEVAIDFDSNEVTVSDNGIGFPDDAKLLLLGGTTKKGSRTTAGLVGVGIKVTMFSSEYFCIRAKTSKRAWSLEVEDACLFDDEDTKSLEIDTEFKDDPSPLTSRGTVVIARFPADENYLKLFADTVVERCSSDREDPLASGFLKTLAEANVGVSPAALLASAFLCRYTYAGDTRRPLGGRKGLEDATIRVRMRCSDPTSTLGDVWGKLWGKEEEIIHEFEPMYIEVPDTVEYAKKMKPPIFNDSLGRGGTGLEKTARGFNVTSYTDREGYEKLLQDANGRLPNDIEKFRTRLFRHVRLISITIGRIEPFHEYLPGGSRRVLSANGVVTEHGLDITSGRNQQYVRCLDFVMDLDAELNYGKTQIKNRYLVGIAKQFLNEAYRRTLQNAAARFVGKIRSVDDEAEDVFWAREDIGVPGLVSRKKPNDENDVIALFAELASADMIEGYHLYGLSQTEPYDSRMIIKRPSDRDDLLESPHERDLKVVEFKVRAASVVSDFEREQKNPEDVVLVIAWEEGTITGSARFAFEDIQLSQAYEASPKKVFGGVTRFINDNRTGRQIQVLLLKDVLAGKKAAE